MEFYRNEVIEIEGVRYLLTRVKRIPYWMQGTIDPDGVTRDNVIFGRRWIKGRGDFARADNHVMSLSGHSFFNSKKEVSNNGDKQ
jgi:hypothetical protein